MKTTLELPDHLVHRIKRHAVQRNQKLKDAIAQLLELGMASAPDPRVAAKPPKPVRLRGRGPLRIDDIEAAIASGRD